MQVKLELRGSALYLDNIMVGMYMPGVSELHFDSSMVIEGVVKDIKYKVDWKWEEVSKLLKEEFHEKEWKAFKLKRGLLTF